MGGGALKSKILSKEKMSTFSFYSFRILKISPYINFKKFFGRILATPSGWRPEAAAPPPCPPSLRHCFA